MLFRAHANLAVLNIITKAWNSQYFGHRRGRHGIINFYHTQYLLLRTILEEYLYQQQTPTMVDAGERLQVLLTQEATNYQTCDYLSRMQGLAKAQETVIEAASEVGQLSPTDPSTSPKKRKSWGDLSSADHSDSQHTESCRRTASTTCASSAGGASVASSSSGTSQINKHWREKICEWAYQGKDS